MFGRKPVYQIAAYRSYGTLENLHVRGRVLEEKGILAGSETDGTWRNLMNMYRRFESDEVPFARVRIRYGDSEEEVTADDEGYFYGCLTVKEPITDSGLWREVDLELIEPAAPARAKSMVLVPDSRAVFGVISDLDDTVIQTGATSVLRLIRNVFMANARTRLPFPGVANFYSALKDGFPAGRNNPLFYVSSSPWNLYDLLVDFMEYQKIPLGPVLLRDWGGDLPVRHRNHKLGAVKHVLETYPHLPFLLIGDSGQHDPEIYGEVVELYPNRIPAVYIRDVSRNSGRTSDISLIAKKVEQAGSTFLLVSDTQAAARHALERGWIAPETV